MDCTCPECHSQNTQRLELVYRQNVSTVNSVTRGVGGGGTSGQLGAGVGLSGTQGIQETALAQLVAPPKLEKLEGVIAFMVILVIIGLICLLDGSYGWGFSLVFLGILAIYGGKVERKKVNSEYLKQMNTYKASFICLRCGHKFIPVEVVDSEITLLPDSTTNPVDLAKFTRPTQQLGSPTEKP